MDRAQLYEENERLVYFALHKYFPGYAFDEDMTQVARMRCLPGPGDIARG